MLLINQYEYLTLTEIEKISEQSIGYFAWKGRDGRFLGGNQAAGELAQLSSTQELMGQTDQDLDWLAGGHTAEYFKMIDQKVMARQILVTNEKEILLLRDRKDRDKITSKITLVSKRPLLHNGICLGVVLHAHDITSSVFPSLLQKHTAINNKSRRDFSQYQSGTKMSPREMECIGFLLRGYSYKKIANLVNLSHRTVEHYIENIKNKLNCHSKQVLIDKLLRLGYQPAKFIAED